MNQHIGLFGGSFDPVHCGHLLAADSVQQQLSLDSLLFLPAARSPFKPSPEVSDADRLAMLVLAMDNKPFFKLDQRELLRSGPSYTIDTLRQLVTEQPLSCFYLIMGMDAWADFESWRNWKEILTLCHLIVMTRPDYAEPVMSTQWQQRQLSSAQQIRQFSAGKLLFIEVPASTAASSDIRKSLKEGRSVLPDLNPGVSAYIERKDLYRST